MTCLCILHEPIPLETFLVCSNCGGVVPPVEDDEEEEDDDFDPACPWVEMGEPVA